MSLPGVSREGLLDLSPARSSPFLLVVQDDDFPLTTRSATRLSPKGSSCCAALSGFCQLPRPQGLVPRSSPLQVSGVSALTCPILPWAWVLSAGPGRKSVQLLSRRSVRALVPGKPGALRSFHSRLSRRTHVPLAPGCVQIDDRGHLSLATPVGRPPCLSEPSRRMWFRRTGFRRTCPSWPGATPTSRPSSLLSALHRSGSPWRLNSTGILPDWLRCSPEGSPGGFSGGSLHPVSSSPPKC